MKTTIRNNQKNSMVEVFAIQVPTALDDGTFFELLNHVTPEKKDRIQRFWRIEDKLRVLFADLLIRSLIMMKTGLPNEEIIINTDSNGKPYLEGRDDFHFNLSHSGIWVVAAVDSRPVGVDVEQIDEVDLSISRNFFSDDEHNDLMAKSDKKSYFFTLWTVKESFIKITGKGLRQPLNSFSIKFVDEDQIAVTSKGKTLDNVSFAQYNIHNDYKMVLCATHDRLPEKVQMQSSEHLLKEFVA